MLHNYISIWTQLFTAGQLNNLFSTASKTRFLFDNNMMNMARIAQKIEQQIRQDALANIVER